MTEPARIIKPISDENSFPDGLKQILDKIQNKQIVIADNEEYTDRIRNNLKKMYGLK